MKETKPNVIDELHNSLYVDEVISGGDDVDRLQELKEQMIKIFREGRFELHKWHSNEVELEDSQPSDHSQTFANQSLGTQAVESSILGLKWNKKEDLISVDFKPAKEGTEVTK